MHQRRMRFRYCGAYFLEKARDSAEDERIYKGSE